MKRVLLLVSVFFLMQFSFAQEVSSCEQYSVFDTTSTPDLGIVIMTDDVETVWNALRLATYSQRKGDLVVLFLIGKGLDGFEAKSETYELEPLKDKYFDNGGQIIACGTCAAQRKTEEIALCTIASISDLYYIIKKSKKVISF